MILPNDHLRLSKEEAARLKSMGRHLPRPGAFKPNRAELRDGLVYIHLTKGRVAVIDAVDYLCVGLFRWHFAASAAKDGQGYARTDFLRTRVYLHHVVLWLSGRECQDHTDHHNGNRLDNRRGNLRPATQEQNRANSGPRLNRKHKGKYKGVCWDSGAGKWRAAIRSKYLGIFSDEETAARVYDKAALELYGEFARLNLPKSA